MLVDGCGGLPAQVDEARVDFSGGIFVSPLAHLLQIFVRMYLGQKVIVVMPAYNAAKTLRKTYDEVQEQGLVDLIILVDDNSRDGTDDGHEGVAARPRTGRYRWRRRYLPRSRRSPIPRQSRPRRGNSHTPR